MYCRNCGSELKNNKFCTNCGCDNSPAPVVEETKTETTPKKSSKAGITVILVVVVIFIVSVLAAVGAVFFFVFKSFTSISKSEFIELDRLMVPSIYRVTGEEYKICGYSYHSSDSEGKMTLDFCSDISSRTLEEYVDYLVEDYGYSLYEGPYKYNLQKEEDGYVIYVLISDNDTIIYSYVKGSLNRGSERIGV